MYAMDVLRDIARDEDIAITRVGLELGKTRQYISGIEQRGSNPRTDTFARMLGVCGYKLCAVRDEEVTDGMRVVD